MSNPNANHAAVRHALLAKKTVPECLSTLDNTCSAGAQCPQVQASPVAAHALSGLQSALTSAHATLSSKQSLAQALMAAMKSMHIDFATVRAALAAYEAAVDVVAKGDASIINKAGLLSRGPAGPPAALGKVAVVHSKPGAHPAEAILSWPRGPGATSYAIEVNFTPQAPAGPWTALNAGAGRVRVVKAPAPGAQLLARVASLGSDGTQSEWTDAILATAA